MKLGLVLEGGAHRTIFSCGVIDVLLTAGIRAEYVIGASAGITYGVSYVSGQRGRNREMLRRFVNDPRYMGLRHLLDPHNRSFYNMRFVFDTIPNTLLPFDYDAYAAFQGSTLAVLTDIAAGRAVYPEVRSGDPEWNILRATCALPLLFSPIEIHGRWYADGGVADSIPFEKALRDGCDRLVVVLTRERSYRKTEEKAMQLAILQNRKRHPGYARLLATRHVRYNACVERLARLERAGRVFVIAPEDTLGVGRTERDVQKLMALYAQGVAVTKRRLPALRAYLNR